MKSGVRALGIAESFTGESSTLAGAVVRASRVTDGFVFGSCTVGGRDATDAIARMVERLDRADVRYLLVAGIAPAWFNVLDLHRLHEETGLPVLSVTFEESEGLEPTLREEFSGEALAWRLDTYRSQPVRERVSVTDETVFVRSVGCGQSEAREVVRAFTPEGGRPEPLRVARLAARAADGAFDSADR
ncbi:MULTISPECIES: DUF99 family protein [unclassified Halorhabdus]|uniref:endonuclease dU n=1 Tax=unclassified Halorhabdus TaxID=2621901 RepID=UPI0023DCA53B|nr:MULTISPECIES: DUF99 family protein [unclassified Halorhabdus]